MTPRQLMQADGAPAALFLTTAQRAKAWVGRPLTTIPLFQAAPKDESDETKAFRVQEEERRRLKSLEGIARMKLRMASKAIDFSKVRWDSMRCKFVPLEGAPVVVAKPIPLYPPATQKRIDNRRSAAEDGWSRVKSDNAKRLAELNGVWDDKYAKLSGGLLVMTVTNRLKGLVKKGGEVKWQ